jgi:hypothetical protein
MQSFGVLLIVTCGLSAAGAAFAQEGGNRLTAERPDIGRLETQIQKSDQALGVVIQLSRPLGAETECRGVCYFPSSTQPTTWRCAPQEKCDLHCAVSPPVGGCE